MLAMCVGCSGAASTTPLVDSAPPPSGVWHADVDRGPLHSIDVDTRYMIATANLRDCSMVPPGGCVVNGVVLTYRTAPGVAMKVAYMQQTIVVAFDGSFYDDGRLRGTLTITSTGKSEPGLPVAMWRTR